MNELDPDKRNRRIEELESRLSRRPAVGVMPPVAAIALAGALFLLWMQREDVEYFFSDRQPIALGVEGDYHFDRAVSNRFAEVHGVPTLRAVYVNEEHSVIVGVQNSPLLFKRRALPTEDWRPGTAPPPPDQRPFSGQGRLLSRAAATRFADAFVKHEGFGEVHPQWLLIEGARPGGDATAMTWVGLLIAFAGVNAWLLARGLLAMLRR